MIAELIITLPPEIAEQMTAIRETIKDCNRPLCQWGEFSPSPVVVEARRQYHAAELDVIRLRHWNEARDLVRKFA